MYRKTINCLSCEVKCDIIIRDSNFENEIEAQYCPICSAEIVDIEDYIEYDDE